MVSFLVWLCVSGWTHPASAQQGACYRDYGAWVKRCEQRAGVSIRLDACPAGKVILLVGEGPSALRIEVSRRTKGAFREVGNFGVSPLGQFDDWSKEPKPRRDALEAVVLCLEEFPRSESDKGVAVPWLLLGALLSGVLGLVAAIRQGYVRPWRREHLRWNRLWRDAAAGRGPGGLFVLLLLYIACFGGRVWLVPEHFFHQNGQGPLWIEAALQAGAFKYGPGYPEVFGWIANIHEPDADRSVFLAMALMSAWIPALGWLLARSVGAPVPSAWIVAALMSIHPLLGRLARSESYLAVQFALLFTAATLLAWAGRHARTRSSCFVLAVLAAGLIVAQSVRIHPTSWLPALAVPLVLLAVPGRPATLLRNTGLAFAIIGGIVVCTSAIPLWDVYAGPLGRQWEPASLVSLPRVPVVLWGAFVGSLAILGAARERFRCLLSLAAGWLAMALLFSADLLARDVSWIADAYRLQFLPVLLASFSGATQGSVARWPRQGPWLVALLLLGLGTPGIALRWKQHTTFPTDALEQAWALRWRSELPQGAHVIYLHRAQDRVLMLPLYGEGPVRATGVAVGPETTPSPTPRPGDYYYRSSLCSTPEGMASCKALEGRLRLQVVEERSLPSVASQPWAPLRNGPVRVGLYRLREGPNHEERP